MKRFLFSLFLVTVSYSTACAQNFNGQWKGEFVDKSTKFVGWGGDKCEYVLELECNGKMVTGYSYTYFTDGGKRFYTICRLEGILDKKNKYIEIKEVERTKTNVPSEFSNCFQVHKLNYSKLNADEQLEGSWIPAPNQQGSCGYGMTTLTRRNLKNSYPGFNSSAGRTASTKITKPQTTTPARKTTPPVVKKIEPQPKALPQNSNQDSFKSAESTVNTPLRSEPGPMISSRPQYEKRNHTIVKTIELETKTVKLDLYDNGEIDGDSVSLFLNGKLLLANQRLTGKPITINLDMDELQDENELVMYAENLGTIPPNTALMIVTDGKKRYEVRITSDLKKSGAIRFLKKEN